MKDWQFIQFERNGQVFEEMYEYSDGCVAARLFLKGKGAWSPPLTTLHEGPRPERAARILLHEIAEHHFPAANAREAGE